MSLKITILNVLHDHMEKKHKNEFPNHEEKRQIELFELIRTDVCGPMQTRSLGGAWYF